MFVNGLTADALSSSSASVVFASSAFVRVNGGSFSNIIASESAGCVYSTSSQSEILLSSVFIANSSAENKYGGVAVADDGAKLTLVNVTISGASAGAGAGAIHISPSATLSISFSSLSYITSGVGIDGQGAIFNYGGILTVSDTSFYKCTSLGAGGALSLIGSGSQVTLKNVNILHGYSTDSGGGIYVSMDSGGGDQPAQFSNILISDCVAANNGGGMWIGSTSNIQFYNNIVIKGGKAENGCGGGLFTQDAPQLYFDSSSIGMYLDTDNQSPTSTYGGQWCMQQTNSADFQYFNSSQNGGGGGGGGGSSGIFIDGGSIWVTNVAAAQSMNAFIGTLHGGVKSYGVPSNIGFTSSSASIVQDSRYILGSDMPTISVAALDYWGNQLTINYDDTLVIVQMDVIVSKTLTYPLSIKLSGQNIKALIDSDNMINFTNYSLAATSTTNNNSINTDNDINCNATLIFTALQGIQSMNSTEPPSSISINVNLYTCASDTVYLDGQCYPKAYVSSAYRLGMGVLGLIGVAFVIATAGAVYSYRMVPIIKYYSPLYLGIIALGATLSLLSCIVQISGGSGGSSCSAAVVLDNIGIFLVLGSLVIKSITTFMLANSDNNSNQRNMTLLSDVSNTRYLGLLQIILVSFLVAWILTDAPVPSSSTLWYGQYVAPDMCTMNSSGFQIGILIARLTVEIYCCYAAYSVSKVRDILERHEMVLVCYNWVFAGILSLVSMYAINDISTSFLLYQISIIVPNVFTVALLLTSKFVACINNPDLAAMIPKIYQQSSRRSTTTRRSTTQRTTTTAEGRSISPVGDVAISNATQQSI